MIDDEPAGLILADFIRSVTGGQSTESSIATSDLLKRVERLAGYRPTIALLGKTGAGKSSLGNALFGREVFKVSDVRAGTREPKPLSAAIFGVDMTLIDFPGVGESPDKDEEYRDLYRSWIDRIDVALWVVKMDDRVLAPDLDYFDRVLKPAGFPLDRMVFVISQADKADPLRDWDIQTGLPGPRQSVNIDHKIAHLREVFSIAPSQVVPVSAEERYNLVALAERMIDACPAEAALNVARALGNDLKTTTVRDSVIKKVWPSLRDFYVSNQEKIHDLVVKLVAELLTNKVRRR